MHCGAVDIDAVHSLVEAVVERLGKFQILGCADRVRAIDGAIEVPHGKGDALARITGQGRQGGDQQAGGSDEPVQGAVATNDHPSMLVAIAGNRQESVRCVAKKEGRPSRWKDGLPRSFVHAQPVRSADLIVKGEASGWWHPGAMGPGVGLVSCGAPESGAEESRLIRRPSVSSQTRSPQLGGNCWSRGQKVRLLLESAGVEFRPSWRLRSR